METQRVVAAKYGSAGTTEIEFTEENEAGAGEGSFKPNPCSWRHAKGEDEIVEAEERGVYAALMWHTGWCSIRARRC